jgi:hypothetical protein
MVVLAVVVMITLFNAGNAGGSKISFYAHSNGVQW